MKDEEKERKERKKQQYARTCFMQFLFDCRENVCILPLLFV